MGLSSLPRLYFRGQFFWSPSTYNNNDYAPALETYDPVTAKLNWSFLREQGVKTDADFEKWSTQPISTKPSQPFTLPPAEWGYYGGNQCGFVTDTIPAINDSNFSIPLGPNRARTKSTGYSYLTEKNKVKFDDSDAWVGLPFQFNANFKPAKLVDINPLLPWTSQVFSDTFSIGDKAKGEGFSAPVKYRMHSRWIYTKRNYNVDGKLIIAGGISTFFQTVVHKKDITFFNSKPKPNSFQAKLQKGLETADGIMIRFTAYDTIYFQGKPFEALHRKADDNNDQVTELMVRIAVLYQKYQEELKEFKEGKRTTAPTPPVNRAYSRVVGWTGLWNKGELISMADGRILLPIVLPGQPKGLPEPKAVQAKGLPADYYPSKDNKKPKAPVTIGPIAVEVVEKNKKVERISVDMGTAMPEHDSTGKKADFGQVKLKLINLGSKSKSNVYEIATLPNDLASYHKTAGVFDITDLSDEVKKAIQDNPLALYVDSYDHKTNKQTSTLALVENPVMSNTNSRGLYAEQPDPYWERAPAVAFTIKVQHYGKAPKKGEVNLAIGQYTSGFELINEDSKAKGPDTFQFSAMPFVELSHEGKVITNNSIIPVPSSGLVPINVKAVQPGIPFLVFYPFVSGSDFKGPGPLQAAPTFYSYNAIRVLPFDNNLAEEFELWLSNLPKPGKVHDLIGRVNQRVFDDVFRTFHLMYPVMDFISNPTKFQEWRGRIIKLTDPQAFESAAYMPVTRSLSAGQRRILVAYVNFLAKLPDFETKGDDIKLMR